MYPNTAAPEGQARAHTLADLNGRDCPEHSAQPGREDKSASSAVPRFARVSESAISAWRHRPSTSHSRPSVHQCNVSGQKPSAARTVSALANRPVSASLHARLENSSTFVGLDDMSPSGCVTGARTRPTSEPEAAPIPYAFMYAIRHSHACRTFGLVRSSNERSLAAPKPAPGPDMDGPGASP